jgi:methionine-rich copper-binding protein CopC
MSSIRIGMLAIAATVGMVSLAQAHAVLKSAGPAPGSVVNTAPKALRIQFNEAIELGFSGVEVTNAKGEKQPTGAASTNPTDKAQLIVPLTGELAPGKYTVVWHAVGDDTHRTEGRYNFEVKQ